MWFESVRPYRLLQSIPNPAPLAHWSLAIPVAIVALSIVALSVRPVGAITIFLDNTNDDEEEEPGWDPGGIILEAHVKAARSIWENLLPSAGNPPATFNIEYHWDADISGLGKTTHFGPCCDILIELNPNQTWFDDPTPSDNSEFNMASPTQTFYSGLNPQQKALFPDKKPPGALEVGFRAAALSPGITGASGNASNAANDLLSTIVHEMGHALGIAVVEPGEYNIYPFHVGGLTDVLVAEDDDSGHLAGDGLVPWLMCQGCGAMNTRRFPTATDTLVVAEEQELPTVHLERVGSITSGSWNFPLNWIGGQIPNATQDVYVRHGEGEVLLTNDAEARSLVIASGNSSVRTQNHRLVVLGGLTVVSTKLNVDAGGEAVLADLQLTDSGDLMMDGGLARIEGQLTITSGLGLTASIDGHGTVQVFDLLQNDGVIRADGGALTFQFASFVPTILDLDGTGTENGQVLATAGDIVFAASLTDPVDSSIEVGEGRTITFVNGWELGSSGVLDFEANLSSSTPATVNGGGATTLAGTILVHGQGVLDTTIGLLFKSTAAVLINSSASRLRLDAFTEYEGGSYTGGGVLDQ